MMRGLWLWVIVLAIGAAPLGAQSLAPELDVTISAAAEADRQDRDRRMALARSMGDIASQRQLAAGTDQALHGQLGLAVAQSLANRPDQVPGIVEAALRAAPEARGMILALIANHFPGHLAAAQSVAARPIAPAPMAASMPTSTPQVLAVPGGPEVRPTIRTPRLQLSNAVAAPSSRPAVAPAAKSDGDEDLQLDDIIQPGQPGAIIDDPWEGFNRAMFAVNDGLDRVILRPLAVGYGAVMPDPAKGWIRNAFDNLKAPVRFINDLLQGEFQAARTTAERFFFNSTIGLAGLFDPATDLGLKRHPADFGQTLHAYGVGSGPYLVLPLIGPTTLRDGIGTGVDTAFSPLTYIVGAVDGLALRAGDVVTLRQTLIEPLDDLRANSIDYYAALRSIWIQNRQRSLRRDQAN